MTRRRRHAARPDAAQMPPSAKASTAGPWIYGRHAVAAALANPARQIRRIVTLSDAAEIVASLLQGGAARPSPEILDRRALEALLPAGAVHQGIAIEAAALEAMDLEDLL